VRYVKYLAGPLVVTADPYAPFVGRIKFLCESFEVTLLLRKTVRWSRPGFVYICSGAKKHRLISRSSSVVLLWLNGNDRQNHKFALSCDSGFNTKQRAAISFTQKLSFHVNH